MTTYLRHEEIDINKRNENGNVITLYSKYCAIHLLEDDWGNRREYAKVGAGWHEVKGGRLNRHVVVA